MMDIVEFLNFKNITQYKFAKLTGISAQTIHYYLTKKCIPNKNILREIYFVTDGRVTPNGIYGVDSWKLELKQLKTEQKLKKQSKQRFSQPLPESPPTTQRRL
jgi:transcriptional regulator with XRE-family HTH domain